MSDIYQLILRIRGGRFIRRLSLADHLDLQTLIEATEKLVEARREAIHLLTSWLDLTEEYHEELTVRTEKFLKRGDWTERKK